jgi:hypothetical protein
VSQHDLGVLLEDLARSPITHIGSLELDAFFRNAPDAI